jgi:hypothetical protein
VKALQFFRGLRKMEVTRIRDMLLLVGEESVGNVVSQATLSVTALI